VDALRLELRRQVSGAARENLKELRGTDDDDGDGGHLVNLLAERPCLDRQGGQLAPALFADEGALVNLAVAEPGQQLAPLLLKIIERGSHFWPRLECFESGLRFRPRHALIDQRLGERRGAEYQNQKERNIAFHTNLPRAEMIVPPAKIFKRT